MEFSWGQWLRGDLASWIAVVIVGIKGVLAYKTWRSVLYIEFSQDGLLTRASNKTIRLNGNIIITRRTTRVICNGTLKVNKVVI